MKYWNDVAVESVLASQGIRLAPGRAAKLAAGLAAGQDAANADDALRDTLPFESDPAGYALAAARCRHE